MLNKLVAKVQAYMTQQDGATAIEYGLIAAGIALAISAAVVAFGDQLNTLFGSMTTTLANAGP
jgi:pilus assembly protein Flp/PilA